MKKLLLITITALVCFSCEKSEINSNDYDVDSEINQNPITMIYKNQKYSIPLDEDQELNSELLPDILKNVFLNGYSLDMNDNKLFYFFDTEKESASFIKETMNLNSSNESNEDVLRTTGTTYFYEHSNYRGGFRTGNNTFYISNLANSPYHFNDRVSSAKIRNTSSKIYVVNFYQHSNRRGRVHTKIVLPNSTGYISNFSPIGFNDITSSIYGYFL